MNDIVDLTTKDPRDQAQSSIQATIAQKNLSKRDFNLALGGAALGLATCSTGMALLLATPDAHLTALVLAATITLMVAGSGIGMICASIAGNESRRLSHASTLGVFSAANNDSASSEKMAPPFYESPSKQS